MPDWKKSDESHWMGAIQAGDADTFSRLYEAFSPTVMRFLRAHVSDPLDVEDLTAEVFLRVWRVLPNYQEQGVPFIVYLLRVSRSVSVDYYRRTGKSVQHEQVEDDSLAGDQPDPSDVLAQFADYKELQGLLRQLNDEYRRVLALRYMSNLSVEETAQMMNKSSGTVRVLQHRALRRLRKLAQRNALGEM